MHIKIISIESSFFVLLYCFLSICIIKMRRRFHIPVGSDHHPELTCAIRAHANFIEYVPLFLILQILLSFFDISVASLCALAVLMVIGRCIHAYSLIVAERRHPPKMYYRVLGMGLTFSSLLISAMLLIYNSFC